MRKREELGKEGRNLEHKRRRERRQKGRRRVGEGRERAEGRWKDSAGEKEVCEELGRRELGLGE